MKPERPKDPLSGPHTCYPPFHWAPPPPRHGNPDWFELECYSISKDWELSLMCVIGRPKSDPNTFVWARVAYRHRGHCPGGHSNGKRGIRLVHGHTTWKHPITYFSGMKKDPKYACLHAFFLICPSCPFQNLSIIMTKNTPFFPILHVFAPLNDVRAYSAWFWKTTLITWIFGRAWYPLDIRVPPPPGHCFDEKWIYRHRPTHTCTSLPFLSHISWWL